MVTMLPHLHQAGSWRQARAAIVDSRQPERRLVEVPRVTATRLNWLQCHCHDTGDENMQRPKIGVP